MKGRVRGLLTADWQHTRAVWETMEEPRPSQEMVRQALNALAQAKAAERDPPLSEGAKPGRRYRWRAPLDLTSNERDIYVGGEVAVEEGAI